MLLFNQKVINKSAIIISFILISSCAIVNDPLGQEKITQLREDAESLFRRQNAVISQVMILTMDEENQALAEAEKAMQDACAELNAYAVRLRDGLGDNLIQQQQVFNSLDECEEATQRLELLLQSRSYRGDF